MTIAAKYENGVFKPLEGVALEEGTVVEVHIPPAPGSKPRSIKNLGFTGMWANREDIQHGVAYLNSLRDNPRSPQPSALTQQATS